MLEEIGEDKRSEKLTNQQVLVRVGEKKKLQNNILRSHILRKNCLLHVAIEGRVTKVKRVGRRRTHLLDYLRNRRRYWELKEEAKIEKDGNDSLSIEYKYISSLSPWTC